MPAYTRPWIFGEVLFDVLPDGREVLGGAPFNVAWHLQGFGCKPLMLSRIGDDEYGKTILERMNDWGMDSSAIQVDGEHPTGTVNVSFHDGEPEYRIEAGVAYDHIEQRAIDGLLKKGRPAFLYHGTLISRSEKSREALQRVIENPALEVFLDVNLRKDCWTPDLVRQYMGNATWVKLNENELSLIEPHVPDAENAAKMTCAIYACEAFIVTRGESGAFVLNALGDVHREKSPKVEGLVDTVGAGDAFSAVMILGLLDSWPQEICLKRAVQFSSEICRMQGAISQDSDLYRRSKHEWKI